MWIGLSLFICILLVVLRAQQKKSNAPGKLHIDVEIET
jgi:hypothetical protein